MCLPPVQVSVGGVAGVLHNHQYHYHHHYHHHNNYHHHNHHYHHYYYNHHYYLQDGGGVHHDVLNTEHVTRPSRLHHRSDLLVGRTLLLLRLLDTAPGANEHGLVETEVAADLVEGQLPQTQTLGIGGGVVQATVRHLGSRGNI